MTRFVDPSVSGSTLDYLDAGVMTGTAYGAIAAGELCMLTESARLMRVDPNLPWAAINQSNPSPYEIFTTAKWVNVTLTGQTIVKCCGFPSRLINRNYAVPMQTSSGISFILRTAAGLEITNIINVSADVSTCIPYTLALDNGNFVIMWHVSAAFKIAIYDGNGNQILAATTVSSSCSTGGMVPWHGHCKLVNGNFALTFATSGGALVGIIYGPTGSVVHAQFTIDASSTGVAHVCAPCANGDFLIGCFDTSHTKHSLYRCTNAGSVSWGAVSRSAATAIFSLPDAAHQHPQHNRLCELMGPGATPNIVWSLPNAGGYCNHYIHDHNGALVRAVDIGNFYHNQNCQDPVTQTPFGFCTAHAPSTGRSTFISFFDWNGYPCGQNCDLDEGGHQFPQGTTPNLFFYTGWCGSGVAISRYHGGSAYGGIHHRLIHCDPHGNRIGDGIDCQPFGPDDMCSPCPHTDWDGTCHVIVFTSITLQITSTLVKVGRSSVIGVAQADAADGAAVTITSYGQFNLPATQVFGPGCAFDQRMAPVPGCRGVVAGQRASLWGWTGSIAAPEPALPPGAPSPIIDLSRLTPAQLTQVQTLVTSLIGPAAGH